MDSRRQDPPVGISIHGSPGANAAMASGAGASAQVNVGQQAADPGTLQILTLIEQLRADLDGLHEVDARTAVSIATASGQLHALEAEVHREKPRREHLKGMLDGVVATVGGLAAVSETVRALIAAVGRLLG